MLDGISPAERNGTVTLSHGELDGDPDVEAAGEPAQDEAVPDAGPEELAGLPAWRDRFTQPARGYSAVGPPRTWDDLLSRWGPGEKIQQSDGTWLVSCPCPGHGRGLGDRNPSLHLSEGEDGRLLARCFAGCTWDSISAALGVSAAWGRVGSVGGDGSFLLPSQPENPRPQLTEAERDLRSAVYRLLLSRLHLSSHHRRQFQARGLSDGHIDAAGYRSLEGIDPAGREALRQELTGQFGDSWQQVPGLRDMPTSGLLVPFRGDDGGILGIQVRRDSEPRYSWLGTGIQATATPHVPLACGPLSADTVRVTEGGIKADVISALDTGAKIKTVGVAGTSAWKAALPLLAAWRTSTVRLAFDQDEAGKKAAKEMAQELKALGYQLELEVWDGKAAKGLDDLLASGQAPEVLAGEAAWERIRRDTPVKLRRRALSREELKSLPDPVWLIDQHFTEESLALVSGESGVGKSFLAIDYSLSIATGLPYLGKYPVKKGPVLYIAAEGGRGIRKRIDAWEKLHGTAAPDFWLLPDAFTFTQHGGDEWAELRANIEQVMPSRPVLVVVDTLARNIGGNENDPLDMGRFLGTCDWLRTSFGSTVLVVHHLGKDHTRGERGHTSLRNAMDTRMILTAVDDNRFTVECPKQKDFDPFKPYLLRKEEVSLGLGRTSLVLVPESEGVNIPTAQVLQQAQLADNKARDGEALFQVVQQNPAGISEESLATQLGWGSKRTKTALAWNMDPTRDRLRKQPHRGNRPALYLPATFA